MLYVIAGLILLIFGTNAFSAYAAVRKPAKKSPLNPTIPYDILFNTYSAIHGVSKRLMVSIVRQESNFNAKAINQETEADKRKGRNVSSLGLAQILYPDTAQSLRPGITESETMIPETNLKMAYELMSGLLRAYPRKDSSGFPSYAVAAYNAGSPRFLGNGTFVNQAYVDSVRIHWENYSYVS